MKIYLGADHRGYFLKEKVAKWLFDNNHDFQDLGAQSLDMHDDYPTYASEVASLVAKEKGKGILFCGSGVGVEIVANKFDGVRAAIGISPAQVEKGRHDDDMNVLVIASDFTDYYQTQEMVKTFLETKFGKEERYKKRLKTISEIEANN